MKEIGYEEPPSKGQERKRLVGYYTGDAKLSSAELNMYLSKKLPQYMIPVTL